MNLQNSIGHVVIIVKENHTFDNYFGTFPGVNGMKMERSPNPPPPMPISIKHEMWLQREAKAVRRQFVEQDIPAYFAYARQFTLCDNYFTDVSGPSWPNHLMLITADSPIVDNPPTAQQAVGAPLYKLPSLPMLLEKAKLTWGNYYGTGEGNNAFDFVEELRGRNKFHADQFGRDASAGRLPIVSWVYGPHPLSEHPPLQLDSGKTPPVGNVTLGMKWTVDQVSAIVKAGLWPKTVIFITWDDWGGWYDHVAPPNVEQWHDGTPFRYGSRVGCLVLSPYAKRGYVSKVLHSHVSLVKFCEKTFGLPHLNARDAAADDMLDCFDFAQKPLPPPST